MLVGLGSLVSQCTTTLFVRVKASSLYSALCVVRARVKVRVRVSVSVNAPL